MGEPTAAETIEIDAPPALVWELVSDVTRTPEWSPVCHRCEWLDPGSSDHRPGARFRGHNRLNGVRWSRDCEVTASEPGRVFAYSTLFKGDESTRWRFTLEPRGAATALTEAYEVVRVPRWVRFLRALPGAAAKTDRDTARNLATSVAAIKRLAERR